MAEEKQLIKFVRGNTLPENKESNALYFKINPDEAGELYLGNKLIAKDHSAEIASIDETLSTELPAIKQQLGELNEAIKNLPTCDCDGKYLLIDTFNEYSDGVEQRLASLEDQVKDVAGAMHFIGAVDADPTGSNFDASGYKAGDVVIYGSKEYVFGKGGKFIELGDATLNADQIAQINRDIQAAQSTANQALSLANSHGNSISDLQGRVAELERGGGSGPDDYDHEALKEEILAEAATAAKESIQGNTDVTVADCVVAINKMNGDLESTQSEIKNVHNFLDMFTWKDVQ
jgi:hypothetical protein